MTENQDNKQTSLVEGVATAVALVAFLAAISFFLSGLLLTGDSVNTETRSFSLSLLFASAFGFLFAALFYSNIHGKKRLGAVDIIQAARGNIISEYFGVYGLIFATPLAIYSYSDDVLMSLVVFVFISVGISVYQMLDNKTSIIERYFTHRGAIAITLLLVAAALGQLIAAFLSFDLLLWLATALLWLTIIFLAVTSWSKTETALE